MDKGRIFIIADCHFNDTNIMLFEREQYSSVAEMNGNLISEWNSVVSDTDTVIVAGDFIIGGDNAREIISALKGKIKLVLGNHDSDIEEYRDLLENVYDYPIVIDDFWIISHYPMYVNMASPYANLYGHVHSNPTYKDVSSRSMCVCTERLGNKPMLLESIKSLVRKEN